MSRSVSILPYCVINYKPAHFFLIKLIVYFIVVIVFSLYLLLNGFCTFTQDFFIDTHDHENNPRIGGRMVGSRDMGGLMVAFHECLTRSQFMGTCARGVA